MLLFPLILWSIDKITFPSLRRGIFLITNDMNIKYWLDTNIVSHFIKDSEPVCTKIISLPMLELKMLVHEFLIRIDVLPWDSAVAECCGKLRTEMQKKGRVLGNLDLLIAAHALAFNLTLITNDQVFPQFLVLNISEWT